MLDIVFNVIKGIPTASVLFLLVYAVFFLSKKRYVCEEKPFAGSRKTALIIVSLLIIVPNLIFTMFQFIGSLDKNFGFKEMQGKVDFRLYRLGKLPDDLFQQTEFSLEEEGEINKRGAVRVIISSKPSVKTPLITIIFRQEKAPADFGPDFPSKNNMSALQGNVKEEFVSIASQGKAYLFGGEVLNGLYFVTTDNVLISFLSPKKTSTETLLEMANNLK